MKYQLPFVAIRPSVILFLRFIGDFQSRRSDMSRIFGPPPLSLSLSLSALLPESSAISEFDATSAIRYRPRKSDCSLWSRNNCGTGGEAGIAGNGFANRKGGIEVERKRERERGGGWTKKKRPTMMMGVRAAVRARFRQPPPRIPPGTPRGSCLRTAGACRWRSPGRNLTRNDSWSVPCGPLDRTIYDIVDKKKWEDRRR